MAVTAAPAPAPCTIKGRGLYLSVWNMIMLSEPPREVANGWSIEYLQQQKRSINLRILTQKITYFSRPALTWPPVTSTTPTNRSTLFSPLASLRNLANSSSNSGRRAMNSSPVWMPSRAAGIRDAVWTEAYDCKGGNVVGIAVGADEMIRDRIVSLRATSKPFRSSAGWGSYGERE